MDDNYMNNVGFEYMHNLMQCHGDTIPIGNVLDVVGMWLYHNDHAKFMELYKDVPDNDWMEVGMEFVFDALIGKSLSQVQWYTIVKALEDL